jgi:class 3 adenylate cyclase
MTCPGCGKENRPGGRFCAGCGGALALACPACGAECEPDDRFCMACGAALVDRAAGGSDASVAPVAERRLVSVLFADLVGFTTLSEHRDPEEVRELLSRYFDRCRILIERYGGTVEKFIGDAVMAVWGTPVAREDDAERAVRAALALTQAINVLGAEVGMPELRVRAGVLTGNAAVELGAEGEGMVLGDTVNTASRLQSLAAPGTVLVDDVARRASEAAIAYEDAGTHEVKGRQQPLHAWTALRVVAGAGGASRGVGLEAPLVGRDAELSVIVEEGEASAARAVARLVSVVGDAGSGKSRLLWEFFKYLDGIEDRRWWHQGRCLSYGEGVAYWALAEMVRARAGILEEEEQTSAREKLRVAVESHVLEERERRLVEPRLAHLLGLEQRTAPDRADLFSGWRLFFERLAGTQPVILAFEDLQWADSGLLDFIDYLLEWSGEFPIFILALGRPELLVARPEWTPTITLGPLGDGAMGELLQGLVPGLPEQLVAQIRRRAEGVPLYAVEIVRMLLDQELIAQEGTRYVITGDVTNLEVPETLHALVAARLDNLDATERALLQDAAVIGQSFMPTTLAAISQRPPAEVKRLLDGLVVKQVLAYSDDARQGERGQYAFLQALLRQVALGTLSRRDRKARHLAAAEHLRASWGDATEIAEVLASHYLAAVDAEPDASDAQAIRGLARQTLADAGRRALSLALGNEARRYFERAAELADEESERARLLAEAGGAAARTADREAAQALLVEAIAMLDAGGYTEDAARTRALLADVLIADRRLEPAAELIDRARLQLTDEALLAALAGRRARIAFMAGDYRLARDESERALSIAGPLRLQVVISDAAITKAIALYFENRVTEAGAMLSLGLQVALDADLPDQALRAYYNLADYRLGTQATSEAATLLERGLALARQRGNREWERELLGQSVEVRGFRGEWDEAVKLVESIRDGADDTTATLAATFLPVILAARGDLAGLTTWLEQRGSTSEWHEQMLIDTAAHAIALHATGRLDEAVALLTPVAPKVASFEGVSIALFLGDVLDILLEAEQTELLEELTAATDAYRLPVLDGLLLRCRGRLHASRGELAEAELALGDGVASLRPSGCPYALARALFDHGCVLAELGQPGDATTSLQEARSLFTELRATAWLERTDGALRPLVLT